MLVSEIIERVQQQYSHGTRSQSSRLSNRRIYNSMQTARMKLIVDRVNKRQSISPWEYQSLNCIELILVSSSECPCIPGKKVLRSKYKLPKVLGNYDSPLIQGVTSANGETTYDAGTWQSVRYNAGRKFTANKPQYFIRNGYLYIASVDADLVLEAVSIPGALFEDPYSVLEFQSYCCNNDNGLACLSPLDMEFPIDGDLINALIAISQQELVADLLKTPEDRFNDSTDNNSPAKR